MKKLLLTSLMLLTLQLLSAQTFYFDFGPDDATNGNQTTSPDVNGNHWNNIIYEGAGHTLPNLVQSDGTSSSYTLTIVSSFEKNGILNGGLLAPSSGLLGDFALATATQDYFFLANASTGNGVLEISGLQQNNGYRFRFFGTRNTYSVGQGTRFTKYTLTGSNTWSNDGAESLQTSGPGSSSISDDTDPLHYGNDNTIIESSIIYVGSDGKIALDMDIVSGGFAYLGVMKMEYAGVLPVEINHFSAEPMENYVQLHWSTATETANTGFEVQRSRDGLYWDKIGFEKGRGTGNSGAGYSFRDTEPFAGKNYYRLRSVDEDGQFKLSDMVSAYVKPAFGRGELSVYPNPATTQVTVELPLGTQSLKLTDQYGKYIHTFELNPTINTNQQLSINTQDLLPGLYILESTGDYGRTSKKFIVK